MIPELIRDVIAMGISESSVARLSLCYECTMKAQNRRLISPTEYFLPSMFS